MKAFEMKTRDKKKNKNVHCEEKYSESEKFSVSTESLADIEWTLSCCVLWLCVSRGRLV